jgi:hypothetical protein
VTGRSRVCSLTHLGDCRPPGNDHHLAFATANPCRTLARKIGRLAVLAVPGNQHAQSPNCRKNPPRPLPMTTSRKTPVLARDRMKQEWRRRRSALERPRTYCVRSFPLFRQFLTDLNPVKRPFAVFKRMLLQRGQEGPKSPPGAFFFLTDDILLTKTGLNACSTRAAFL